MTSGSHRLARFLRPRVAINNALAPCLEPLTRWPNELNDSPGHQRGAGDQFLSDGPCPQPAKTSYLLFGSELVEIHAVVVGMLCRSFGWPVVAVVELVRSYFVVCFAG